jgi:ubiquinone/menaquinone biosynthesis C-methylase UbiE
MFDPVTQALIQDANIVTGQSVLDVAGGPGEPSLTISSVVGLSGFVTCTDGVAEMVAAAETEAKRLGIRNMKFLQCTADSLPFENNSFDTVVSRLGVMFFPQVIVALREMLRVLKPDSSISLAVWGRSEANPYAHGVTEVISRYVKTPPADPDAPEAFRFAERGKLAKLLRDAGAKDVYERELVFRIEGPMSVEQFWTMRSEISETLREKLKQLTPEQASQVATEVKEAVQEYFPDGQMSFPAEMIIVTGTKSS